MLTQSDVTVNMLLISRPLAAYWERCCAQCLGLRATLSIACSRVIAIGWTAQYEVCPVPSEAEQMKFVGGSL